MRNNTYYGALFFPAFLLLLVFRFLRFPGVYLRLLKKKNCPLTKLYLKLFSCCMANFMNVNSFLWFIGGSDVLKVVVIAYVVGGYNGKYYNWSKTTRWTRVLRFFVILFMRQISRQTLNLCPSPVFETLSNEFKIACVFSQLVIQLINRNRLEIPS